MGVICCVLTPVPTIPQPSLWALCAVPGPGHGAERQAGPAQAACGLAEERPGCLDGHGHQWQGPGRRPLCSVSLWNLVLLWKLFVLFSLWYERSTFGALLGGPVLRTWHFRCCGPLSSIPGQGTKIPQAGWHGQINNVLITEKLGKTGKEGKYRPQSYPANSRPSPFGRSVQQLCLCTV